MAVQPSAREWIRRLDDGELSSRELAEHYFERIDAENPRLNAVVEEDRDQTLADADRADEERRNGERKPLLGLPMTIKSSIDVRGLVSACGSFARIDNRAQQDATLVARLRDAGAIFLGLTNVPEYMWSYETENEVYGTTNNALDVERTPGGSSGGEGAIIGADASPAGIGTDGGGSIRCPSHFNGIVGVRPSTKRVPETGIWGESRWTGMHDMNCPGPMARYVEDLALLLPIISGPDWIDPMPVPVPVGDPATVDVATLRVAYYTDDGFAPTTPATKEAVETAARALADAGAEVEEARPESLGEATELFFAMMAADGGQAAREDLAPANGRHVAQMAKLLEDLEPLALDAYGFFQLQRRFFALRARIRTFLTRYDLIVAPTAAGCAPRHHGWAGESVGSTSYDAYNYLHAFACAGVPTACVPVGQEEGMPIGVQVAAQAFADHVALAGAAVLEQASGGFRGVRERKAAHLG
jgi:amidase